MTAEGGEEESLFGLKFLISVLTSEVKFLLSKSGIKLCICECVCPHTEPMGMLVMVRDGVGIKSWKSRVLIRVIFWS